MEFLFLWLPLCILLGFYASKAKDRSGIGWFFVAFLISPLLALLLLLILGEKNPAAMKTCPQCAERIRAAAQKCRYCHSKV
jgi:hypothetical protein